MPQVAAAAIGMGKAAAPSAEDWRRAGGIGGGSARSAPIASQEYGGIREDQKEAGQRTRAAPLLAAAGATALERVGMGKLFKGIRGELPPMAKIPAEIAKGSRGKAPPRPRRPRSSRWARWATRPPASRCRSRRWPASWAASAAASGRRARWRAEGARRDEAIRRDGTAHERDGTGSRRDATRPERNAGPGPATPEAIRAQKLPGDQAADGRGERWHRGRRARSVEPPLSEDDRRRPVPRGSKRQDGTPQGARFCLMFDAGQISPREAYEAFRLERSPAFTLPQPGVSADRMPLQQAAALAQLASSSRSRRATRPRCPSTSSEPAPGMPEDPRARTPRVEAAPIDPAAPNAVAQYIDRLRAINTRAAQAFVRDFEAGRISPQVVLDSLLPRQQESVDQRLAAAAARGARRRAQPAGGIAVPDGRVRCAGRAKRAPPRRPRRNKGSRRLSSRCPADRSAPQVAAQQPARRRRRLPPPPSRQPALVRRQLAMIEHVTRRGRSAGHPPGPDPGRGDSSTAARSRRTGPTAAGSFIRERSLDKLAEHDARKAGGSATAAPSVRGAGTARVRG